MPIYYGLVARASTVLVDYTENTGNFEQITMCILQKIPTGENTKCSYASGSYQFHVVINDHLTFMCMADESFGKRLPYGFLNEIIQKFNASPLKARAEFAGAYEFKRDFTQTLAKLMTKYNSGNSEDPDMVSVNKVRREVQEVKGIMTQNIDKVLERGAKLEILVEKTEDLEQSSQSFKRQAVRMKRKAWWQNARCCVMLIVVVIILLGGVALLILYLDDDL